MMKTATVEISRTTNGAGSRRFPDAGHARDWSIRARATGAATQLPRSAPATSMRGLLHRLVVLIHRELAWWRLDRCLARQR
jgi:hypothetical protein